MKRRSFFGLLSAGASASCVTTMEYGSACDDFVPVLYPPEFKELADSYNAMRRETWTERAKFLQSEHWVKHGMQHEVYYSPLMVQDWPDWRYKWCVSTFINIFVVYPGER